MPNNAIVEKCAHSSTHITFLPDYIFSHGKNGAGNDLQNNLAHEQQRHEAQRETIGDLDNGAYDSARMRR